MKKRQRRSGGFTLVEMIVVIAIIGILATLVVPQVAGYVKKAQDNTNQANGQAIYTAALLYLADQDSSGGAPITSLTMDMLKSAGYITKSVDGKVKIDVGDSTTNSKTIVTVTYTATKGSGLTYINGEAQAKQP